MLARYARCVVTLVLFASTAPLSAQSTSSFADFLAAGEFAPALQAAQQHADARQRDSMLAQLAAAQRGAGARSASLSTLALLRNDTLRYNALAEGQRGGGAAPDFNSLMDLLKGTIAPTTWTDVGGQGAVRPFAGGVIADAQGMLQRVAASGLDNELAVARYDARRASENQQVRQASALRKVSLPRLEKEVLLRLAAGKSLDEELLTLAGLQRIRYVFIYPETGDVVLAGPAGDWKLDAEGRRVAIDNGRPVVRLEDLVTLVRQWRRTGDLRFGCSIIPTKDGLSRTQAYLAEQSKRPLKPGTRQTYLDELRRQLGPQDIEVYGVEANSRIAQVIVEADYRMKLVGLGLEPSVLGVTSYLDSIKVDRGAAPPPMNVLRWWFTLNYDGVMADRQREAYEFRGTGVKVLSENELLTQQGDRVHTGRSDDLNRQFAASFTQHFAALANKYPVYAELQNVFDLALLTALLAREQLAERVEWHALGFADAERWKLTAYSVPRQVDTVINHRVIEQVHVVAAVSGGVTVDAAPLVESAAIRIDPRGQLDQQRQHAQPTAQAVRRWWWD